MNIKQAKEQIIHAMKAYFSKDEYGNYRIPPEAQRPVFLMGPPGIGKTAIMKQVADELGVGLVSYSMTHHTRQSALGLPVIREKNFGGRTVSVSEYTMSEIIASVYEMMEEGNTREGILFLDEINCVSETLTPVMLQFLQYKVFGKHRVPDGWLVVAAGNPVEYNRSARDFDIVTWDRLKRIDIDVDYPTWREYAANVGAHPAVLTYLDARRENFYKIERNEKGRSFVTARSWLDLSDMIRLCEPLDIQVDILLISQYLQDREIAEDFAVYYELFNKYRSDYQIAEILSGKPGDAIRTRAKEAGFDERLSLMGLLMDETGRRLKEVVEDEDFLTSLLGCLRDVKAGEELSVVTDRYLAEMQRREKRGTLTLDSRRRCERTLAFLRNHVRRGSDFNTLKEAYDGELGRMREKAAEASAALENLFYFTEDSWGCGNEMILLLSGLTSSVSAARFIARYGSPAYYRHNEELMFYKRRLSLEARMKDEN